MLRWQQPKQSDVAKIFAWSSALHIIICAVLFFSTGSQTLFQVSSTKSEVIVRLISFGQSTPTKQVHKNGTQLKSATKKVEPKKIIKPVQKKQIEKKPVTKKIEPKKEVKRETQPVVKKETTEEIKPVSQKELDAITLQQVLQEAVSSVWAPPAGMEGSLVCDVSLTIGWDGKLLQTTIEKSSGVLVYDIAVEQAVDQLEVPRQLWGKTIRIAFKP